jgi:FlaA1/EpsC-like NDP-sugar epimerase
MRIFKTLVALPRLYKRAISVFFDIAGLIAVGFIAVWIRLGEFLTPIGDFQTAVFILPLIALPVFIVNGFYRAIVRYIGQKFMWIVVASVSVVFVIWAASIFMLDIRYPRSAILIAWLLCLLYILGTRGLVRWLLSDRVLKSYSKSARQVVIYGAGSSGKQLLDAIGKIPSINVVAFVDDDKALQKHEIASLKIYHPSKLLEIIASKNVTEIFLACAQNSHQQRKSVLDSLEHLPVKVFALPSIDEIVSGKVSFSDLREVNIDDILGRDAVTPKPELLSESIKAKNVLITGAGGSIGSELCRQIVRQEPASIVLFELSEFALYSVHEELTKLIQSANLNLELIPILGDVKNKNKFLSVLKRFSINTIYHAAAYKHVPIVEHNIAEGLKNNTFGTLVAAEVAAECGVENFVLISTDKAVRPTNFMGASKRLAEMCLQALQHEFPLPRFVMVRFGNVLGSSGSVIPLFKQQIANGGPVTVTHKEITRYFMTIPEAASLVIQAGSMGVGGDVFVLDMGEPVKIADLAAKLINLSGLEIKDADGNGDIAIEYTGLRPGEKLYEELLIGEHVDGTDHPRIMKAHEDFIDYQSLKSELEKINTFLESHDYQALSKQLSELVSGFNHTSGIVDYIK